MGRTAAELTPREKEEYWRADCRLEEIAEGFEIDLVDLQTAPTGLEQVIRRDGIEI